jgi:hypothetical protein
MMKRLSFVVALGAVAALSARSPDPEPQPDPAQVERLLASIEAEQAAPDAVQEKLAKADRIVTAVDRSDPDRLAGAAERLLAR